MIKLQVIGNLGKDALLNQVGGKNVINFTVAHTEKFKDSSGAQKEKTTWVECAYWTDRTGVAPYLKKGAQVYVEGTPEVRQFTKSDGSAGASLTLRVLSLQLVGGKADPPTTVTQGTSTPTEDMASSFTPVAPAEAEDLPF